MQHANLVVRAQRAVRSKICTQCWRRPVSSESMDPLTARVCEPGCSIFINIPRLLGIAKHDPTQPFVYENRIRNIVCSVCEVSPTAGDFCEQDMSRTCPLSRYAGEILPTLEVVLKEYMKAVRSTLPSNAGKPVPTLEKIVRAAPVRQLAD